LVAPAAIARLTGMLLPDPATLQVATAWVGIVAGFIGLAGVLVGLFSVLTGRDHWPTALRRLRRRTPASQEDMRRHGITLVLNGAAVLIAVMGTSINNFSVQDHTIGEPLNTLRFVLTGIGVAGLLTCVIGAYSLSLTVQYKGTDLRPEVDPLSPL
jgi:hypothetical protein